MIDPLAFDNVHGLGGSLPNGNAASRPTANGSVAGEDITGVRRGGQRTGFQDPDAIPRVKDATGEKVMESFALFLEKWVPHPHLVHRCMFTGRNADGLCLAQLHRADRTSRHAWFHERRQSTSAYFGRVQVLHGADQGDEGVRAYDALCRLWTSPRARGGAGSSYPIPILPVSLLA